jgi:hypothetical protein
MKNKIKHPLERYKLIADSTIRQQCIDNFDEEFYKKHKNHDDGSIEYSIILGFNWHISPEKTKYWSKIRLQAIDGILSLLPEPIEEPSELNQLRSENEKLRENQIPESLVDFINDVKWMVGCYQNQRYTTAESKRDSLAEVLDDIMRLPKEKTQDY